MALVTNPLPHLGLAAPDRGAGWPGRRRVVAVLASAFAIVFGIFIAAFAALCLVIVTWAVRRDRSRWREWKDRDAR